MNFRESAMRKTLAAVAVAAALALTACGSRGPAVVYDTAPSSYGENGHCYYADYPGEVTALQQAGLCPSGWAAAPMPVVWRNRYAWYYDSPTYYNRYVPVSYRSTYVTHVHVYERANPSAVRKAPPRNAPAPWVASSFRAGSRPGGDAGTSRVSSRSSSGSRQSSSRSSSSFRSGSRR